MKILETSNQMLAIVTSFLILIVLFVSVLLLLFKLIDYTLIYFTKIKEKANKLYWMLTTKIADYYWKKEYCGKCQLYNRITAIKGKCDYGLQRKRWDKCFKAGEKLYSQKSYWR